MDISNLPLGLLKFCLNNTQRDDPTRLSETPHRDPKDLEWLRKALDTAESDIQRMKRCLEVVKDSERTNEDKLAALEELQTLVEDIDNANDLHKIGGFLPMLDLMRHNHAPFRKWAADILGSMIQNNPHAQKLAMAHSIMQLLLDAYLQEHDDEVRFKILGALSALLSDSPAAYSEFLTHNGLRRIATSLVDAAHPTTPRTVTKAMTVLRKVILRIPSTKDTLRELGFFSPLLSVLKDYTPNDDSTGSAVLRVLQDQTLALAADLVRDNAANIAMATQMELPAVISRLQSLPEHAIESSLLQDINDTLEGRGKHRCMACGKLDEKMAACAKCKSAFYCNRECQRADWPLHKLWCK